MKKVFSFIFILISYLFVIYKVASLPLMNSSFPNIYHTPLASFFTLSVAMGSAPEMSIARYLLLALFILLSISWVIVIITLFLGIVSKKTRKILFVFSIIIAIYDVAVLSFIAVAAYTVGTLIRDLAIFQGLILAICVIIVNTICLILTSKGTNKRKIKA